MLFKGTFRELSICTNKVRNVKMRSYDSKEYVKICDWRDRNDRMTLAWCSTHKLIKIPGSQIIEEGGKHAEVAHQKNSLKTLLIYFWALLS